MALSIRVQFLAGYSGREWPPSPARLFKALVASARSGWALTNRTSIDGTLRVLEQQGWANGTALPEIVAPRAPLRTPRQRRFVPNNSKNWPPERRLNPEKGFDLEPEPLMGWEIEAPCTVWYWWPDVASSHVPIVRAVSRRISSVGKGEDFAVLDATDERPPAAAAHWRAARIGAALEVPEPGCLDVCDAVFGRDPHQLPLSAAGVQSVLYAAEGDAASLQPPVGVLALWRDGKRRSWDARLLRQVVGPIRNLLDEIRGDIVDLLTKGPNERARLDALVRRVLLGHDESDQPVAEPHLAILPLPSVLGPHPDGRVRRVVLAGFGCTDDPNRRAIVELAHVLLHGRELRDNGRGTGVVLGTEPDGQWLRTITRRSRSWVTVTPMVQAAKELTSSEWRRLLTARRAANEAPQEVARLEERLRSRRLELVERSLRQAIGEQGARVVSIEFGSGGPIAGVHTAPQYRANGYLGETPRLHLRVIFDRPVAGPIAVGRGRHVGFGVLWPSD